MTPRERAKALIRIFDTCPSLEDAIAESIAAAVAVACIALALGIPLLGAAVGAGLLWLGSAL